MISNSIRDMDVMPAFVGEYMRAQIDGMRAVLLEAWPEGERNRRLSIAVSHALDFRTWQSLASHGLSPGEAGRLMTPMVACLHPEHQAG